MRVHLSRRAPVEHGDREEARQRANELRRQPRSPGEDAQACDGRRKHGLDVGEGARAGGEQPGSDRGRVAATGDIAIWVDAEPPGQRADAGIGVDDQGVVGPAGGVNAGEQDGDRGAARPAARTDDRDPPSCGDGKLGRGGEVDQLAGRRGPGDQVEGGPAEPAQNGVAPWRLPG